MLPRSLLQAWISGLPGLIKEGGITFKILPITMPKAEVHSLSFTLYGSSELVADLRSLSKQRTVLSTLSLVVRTDAAKELDDQFLMTNAVIDSILPLKDLAAVQVNILFNSISARMGVTLNPGPPVDHPPVRPAGVNLGWIFRLPNEDIQHGRPVEVLDFTPPYYDRQLAVTIGKPSDEIKSLAHGPSRIHELILVLPDPANQRYIEFKLWEAKVSLMENERRVVFESDFIECLVGEDN